MMSEEIVRSKYRGRVEYYQVMTELIVRASHKGLVSYQEIAQILGWPLTRNKMGADIGHLLGEISEDEVDVGRPMLSAIATRKSGTPGPGFYALATSLGMLKNRSKSAESKFWTEHLSGCYETWARGLR